MNVKIYWIYVTVVLDKDTLSPVSILIHSGASHDIVIYKEILKELKRRRLFTKRTLLCLDRRYYSLENYKIGINRYKIVPIIASKYDNTIQKIKDNLSYPLEVFNSNNNEDSKK
ncbi:transposase [Methanosphaera sp. BMS]|uniref:transposase n=1 Tax=Methanosphaera sp. BMS TaxID=1789762 RepID=UPI0013A692AC|nr:transposase [Methanosphaera sp. BMS]